MTKIMKGKKVLIEFDPKTVRKTKRIPPNIRQHWNKNKSILEYSDFKGLTKKDALKIFSLAKGGKVRLSINRMGDIIGYKIK